MALLSVRDGLFYQSGGSGEKILWLHGYTMDHTIWPPLWDGLSEYSYLAPDLPGHGRSRGWKTKETLSDIAKEIGAFALEEGCEHIVGISLGGMVSLQVAIEYPNRFKSLILNAAPLGGGPQEPSARIRNQELRNLYALSGKQAGLNELWMKSPPEIFEGARKHPVLFEQLQSLVAAHSWEELATPSMAFINNYPQTEQAMKKIAAHTLILIGENDMVTFKRIAEIMRRSVPGAERIYLPDCGHLALIEEPSLCLPLIRHHLQKSSAALPAFSD